MFLFLALASAKTEQEAKHEYKQKVYSIPVVGTIIKVVDILTGQYAEENCPTPTPDPDAGTKYLCKQFKLTYPDPCIKELTDAGILEENAIPWGPIIEGAATLIPYFIDWIRGKEEENVIPWGAIISGVISLAPTVIDWIRGKEEENVVPWGLIIEGATTLIPYVIDWIRGKEEENVIPWGPIVSGLISLAPTVIDWIRGKEEANYRMKEEENIAWGLVFSLLPTIIDMFTIHASENCKHPEGQALGQLDVVLGQYGISENGWWTKLKKAAKKVVSVGKTVVDVAKTVGPIVASFIEEENKITGIPSQVCFKTPFGRKCIRIYH